MYPVISIGSFEIASYIAIYIVAFIAAGLLLKRELRREKYPTGVFVGLYAAGLLFGLIGSKIYYILHNWQAFTMDPYQTIFDSSGSGWYGGFVLGAAGILGYLKIKGLPILKFLDILAPIIAIGQVFGRLGCFFGGCCHGTPSNLPWAVLFPNSLYPPHVKVHPTQIYEMIIYFAVFIFLSRYKKYNTKEGKLFALYLILAGAGRFFIEFIRTNPKIVGQFSAPHILAFICVLSGTFLVLRINKSTNAVINNPEESF